MGELSPCADVDALLIDVSLRRLAAKPPGLPMPGGMPMPMPMAAAGRVPAGSSLMFMPPFTGMRFGAPAAKPAPARFMPPGLIPPGLAPPKPMGAIACPAAGMPAKPAPPFIMAMLFMSSACPPAPPVMSKPPKPLLMTGCAPMTGIVGKGMPICGVGCTQPPPPGCDSDTSPGTLICPDWIASRGTSTMRLELSPPSAIAPA
mmetsp:Transcript_6609/g.18823  ORF Transcript_6609/g.18823 Transcript_6609/m.18823 type:complete len:203 (-) Transcript_6609:42-650(-)